MGDELFKSLEESSSSGGFADWTNPKSVMEHNKRMLVKQIACDVIFVVGDANERIGAHRYVLISQSEVFKNMFTGRDAVKCVHYLPEIYSDCFLQLLAHAYYRGETLQDTNVVGVMYAADQFEIKELQQKCRTFLHDCLKVNNMFYLLDEVKKFGYKEEERYIMSFVGNIFTEVQRAVGIENSPGNNSLQDFRLPDFDVDKFLRAEDFVDKSPKNRGTDHKEAVEKRIVDTRPSLDHLMSNSQPNTNAESSLQNSSLTKTIAVATVNSVRNVNENSPINGSIKTHPSENFYQITRLIEENNADINNANKADAISFTVSGNIHLHGFSIYGPINKGEAEYTVDTLLYSKRNDVIIQTFHIKSTGIIFPVMFKHPVYLEKDCLYTLEVYIKGPESHLGMSGQKQIQYGPVVFTFSNAKKVKRNRTDIAKGQIPRLFFSLQE